VYATKCHFAIKVLYTRSSLRTLRNLGEKPQVIGGYHPAINQDLEGAAVGLSESVISSDQKVELNWQAFEVGKLSTRNAIPSRV
jgi:hypothetical protein